MSDSIFEVEYHPGGGGGAALQITKVSGVS